MRNDIGVESRHDRCDGEPGGWRLPIRQSTGDPLRLGLCTG